MVIINITYVAIQIISLIIECVFFILTILMKNIWPMLRQLFYNELKTIGKKTPIKIVMPVQYECQEFLYPLLVIRWVIIAIFRDQKNSIKFPNYLKKVYRPQN